MSSTRTFLTFHIVFSTKDRLPMLIAERKEKLYAYIVGIVRGEGGELFAIGGGADHVHMLLKIPPVLSVAELLRLVKSNSSKWANEQPNTQSRFSWQRGYAAFSVSQSSIVQVIEYIKHQESHHTKVSFQHELIMLLKKHGVEYDERYIWS